jgi:N-acetylmuramoyl-L-alanine amidase-like protein
MMLPRQRRAWAVLGLGFTATLVLALLLFAHRDDGAAGARPASHQSTPKVIGSTAPLPREKAPPPAPTPAPKAATPVSAPVAVAAAVTTKPRWKKKLIPFGPRRRREMAAYSQRHYGDNTFALTAPKVIVEHYAVAGSLSAIFNIFAPDHPDPELHELPNVCSHFAVGPTGKIWQFVPLNVRCRHTVGLNYTSIGIEHVGFSDQDILGRPAQLKASLRLTHYLQCRFGITLPNVIGHNESLSSPFHKELVPSLKSQTHGDWTHADMETYRRKLAARGSC